MFVSDSALAFEAAPFENFYVGNPYSSCRASGLTSSSQKATSRDMIGDWTERVTIGHVHWTTVGESAFQVFRNGRRVYPVDLGASCGALADIDDPHLNLAFNADQTLPTFKCVFELLPGNAFGWIRF